MEKMKITEGKGEIWNTHTAHRYCYVYSQSYWILFTTVTKKKFTTVYIISMIPRVVCFYLINSRTKRNMNIWTIKNECRKLVKFRLNAILKPSLNKIYCFIAT